MPCAVDISTCWVLANVVGHIKENFEAATKKSKKRRVAEKYAYMLWLENEISDMHELAFFALRVDCIDFVHETILEYAILSFSFHKDKSILAKSKSR